MLVSGRWRAFLIPKTFNLPKEKDKKKFPKILKILIFLLLIILIFGYFFFYSSIFKIKNINVDNSIPSEANIVLEKFKDQNIFLVNSTKVYQELIKQFPDLEKIKLQRGLPDTIKISGEIYQAQIIWQTEGHSFLVNNDGIAFREVEGITDLPIVLDSKNLSVTLPSQVVSTNFIKFIVEFYSKFPEKTGFRIINFIINETIFQTDALTDQGWFIKLDTTRSADEQLEALKKFLAENKDEIHEYADLRVEGRVYYK